MRTMINWFRKGCEYVFPERKDHRVTRETELSSLLPLLRPGSREGIISLLPFKDSRVRAIVHEAKFQGNERAFALLSGVLSEYLKDKDQDTVLMPIPLSAGRLKERGYNQVEEVLKRLEAPHSSINTVALKRNKETKPQTTLSRNERLVNVAGAFIVSANDLAGKKIIVIDDVSTTGATLKAAEAALRPHFPTSITLLSLAR